MSGELDNKGQLNPFYIIAELCDSFIALLVFIL